MVACARVAQHERNFLFRTSFLAFDFLFRVLGCINWSLNSLPTLDLAAFCFRLSLQALAFIYGLPTCLVSCSCRRTGGIFVFSNTSTHFGPYRGSYAFHQLRLLFLCCRPWGVIKDFRWSGTVVLNAECASIEKLVAVMRGTARWASVEVDCSPVALQRLESTH